MENPNEAIYLKKSILFFKIYAGLFLFAILMSIIRPSISGYESRLDLLIGLPVFAMFIMAPIGLFYSWKSYKRKEGFSRTRLKFFIGHFFFCILILVFITAVLSDLLKLFE